MLNARNYARRGTAMGWLIAWLSTVGKNIRPRGAALLTRAALAGTDGLSKAGSHPRLSVSSRQNVSLALHRREEGLLAPPSGVVRLRISAPFVAKKRHPRPSQRQPVSPFPTTRREDTLAASEPKPDSEQAMRPAQAPAAAPCELPANLAELWNLAPGITYLNHGSFGLTPMRVLEAQARLRGELTDDPVDFLCRRYQPYLNAALAKLAGFVGTFPSNLVFVDNATTGMNAAAVSLSVSAGDEIIVGDHEYGAVARLWRQVSQRAGAIVHTPTIPAPIDSTDALIDALLQPLNSRTRVLVVSHVTSATAVVFPLDQMVAEARRRHAQFGGGPLWIVVDGPHALLQVPLQIDRLDVDCYTASCHKWLSAPIGSGFLYAHPRVQSRIRPALTSWGTMPADEQENFQGEFHWPGTRDPSAWLAVPAAIELFASIGLERFRNQTHELARYARAQLIDRLGAEPLVPDSPDWYASMVALALPEPAGAALGTQAAKRRALGWQQQLWERAGIEVPLNVWGGRTVLRVSCHLYNRADQIDRLVDTLAEVLKSHQ